MFRKLFNKASSLQNKNTKFNAENSKKIKNNIDTIKEELKKVLGDSADLVIRKISLNSSCQSALVVFLDNMVDLDIINESIIARLQNAPKNAIDDKDLLVHSVLSTSKVSVTSDFDDAINQILYGNTAIFISGFDEAIITDTVGYKTRNIQPPEIEVSIEGPKDAFVESIFINQTLIRRRLVDRNLRFEQINIGRRTNTLVTIGYIDGLTDPGILAEVKKRLLAIDTDGVFGIEMLHEYLADCPLSIFPTVLKSERPETTVSCLTEGRVTILADGYPFALTVPTTFAQYMQAGDDYYQNFYYGTFIRWIRYLSYFITLTLPSLYIALVTHHWEMLPTPLALAIAGSREGVPLPAATEVFAMELTFEILREAGVRLPKAVGQAVSIVGALVIGQSAVQAGLISPGVVIVVAFTGIASFTIPRYTATTPIRLLRFPLMLFTSQLGLPGLVSGLLVIWGYMTNLTSLGVPYLAPFSPTMIKDFKDTIFRFPRWAMNRRPQSVPSLDKKRVASYVPPKGDLEK